MYYMIQNLLSFRSKKIRLINTLEIIRVLIYLQKLFDLQLISIKI